MNLDVLCYVKIHWPILKYKQTFTQHDFVTLHTTLVIWKNTSSWTYADLQDGENAKTSHV